MSTIKDVAHYTGLSIATISKYLNGGNVLEKNRALIAEAIHALDYKVNQAARSLKTRRTMTVGTLLPTFNTPFFSEICAIVESFLKKHGYTIIMCSYYDDPKEEIEKLQFLTNINVDGILLVPQYITADDINAIRAIHERETPMVLMDRYIPSLDCDRVLADNTSATYNAVEHLIVNGHRRIGLIVGPTDITTGFERQLGYERVHNDYAIPIEPKLIQMGDYSIRSGYSAMSAFLDMHDPPTAVMGTNYDMTLGAITVIYERNLRIPDDLSFIGYDGIELTKIMNPPITIVRQPVEEIARHTAELLITRMQGDYTSFPQVLRLKTELLLHQSTRRRCTQ